MQNNVNTSNIHNNCILCGNCSAICPKGAISFDNIIERVVIDKNLCIKCGLCLKNCPAVLKDRKENTLLGHLENIYAGFSNNEEIRYKSASGGLLTQTLKYLTENKMVDKVLITDFCSDSLQAESFFTDDIQKIINACGSKYQIVNVNKALKAVLKDNLKYAYVGLPCHHVGLEKFIKENPKINDRILYKFAICCSHNSNIKIIDYVCQFLKIKKEDIKSIKYRGDGWPEYLTITTINDEKLKFPKNYWNDLFLSFFYTPKQCFKCTDFCGENSDISFADAWLEEYTSIQSDGYNLVFSHTQKGEKLLQEMFQSNEITLNKHSSADVIKSQIIGLFYKKHIYKSLKPGDLLLKTIIKLNSKISKYGFFKFVNPLFLKYYFYILNKLFINKNLCKYREKILHENSNC